MQDYQALARMLAQEHVSQKSKKACALLAEHFVCLWEVMHKPSEQNLKRLTANMDKLLRLDTKDQFLEVLAELSTSILNLD